MASKSSLEDDNYIAALLAKDARDSSIKYSAMGLQAFMPKRPTTNAPKPNTRFLQNIIRETDNHNAALKRKEVQDAGARLRGLRNGTLDKNGHGGREKKRRRIDDTKDDYRRSSRKEESHSKRPRRHHNSSDSDSEDYSRSSRRHRSKRRSTGSLDDGERAHKLDSSRRRDNGDPRDGHRHRRRNKSYSPSEDEAQNRESKRRKDYDRRRHRGRHHSSRSRSRSRSSTSPPRHDDSQSHKRRHSPSPSPTTTESKPRHSRPHSSSSDSDPLEALVGPLPPPPKPTISTSDPPPLTSRGRNSYRPSISAIDSHFSSGYDPILDLHPESPTDPKETEDWDMALEALRDRQLWKQKGAERLRLAGFGETEIAKWEKSDTNGDKERDIGDVKWVAKSEEREWDRGKVMLDEDAEDDMIAAGKRRGLKGEVGLEAAWKPKGKDGKGGGFLNSFKRALG